MSFKIEGGLVHDFNNTRGFDTFLKIGRDLMHDFKNIRRFDAFYPILLICWESA